MSIYLDLLPPPQFDRSLVSYTVGNFQRIKDALVRASGRVYLFTASGIGAYPVSFTIATPFRSDVLVSAAVGGYIAGGGLTGVNTYLDGAATGYGTMLYYFNLGSTHQAWSAFWVVRNQAAGNHVWGFQAGGGLLSDGNDKIFLGLTFVEV